MTIILWESLTLCLTAKILAVSSFSKTLCWAKPGFSTSGWAQNSKISPESEANGRLSVSLHTLSSAFKTCFYIIFLWRETSVLSKMSVSGKKKKSVKFQHGSLTTLSIYELNCGFMR